MILNKNDQLRLNLEKNALKRFDDFDATGNKLSFETLRTWPENIKMIHLQGPVHSGKTHLAEAVAERALNQQKQVLLLSGKLLPAPHFFYDLPRIDYLILDDMDQLLLFSPQYEEALFALYNQVFDMKGAHLLLTSATPLQDLPIKLKDLKSRLQGIPSFRLQQHPSQVGKS